MEYLKLGRMDTRYQCGENLKVELHIFHRIPQFKYLGVLLTS